MSRTRMQCDAWLVTAALWLGRKDQALHSRLQNQTKMRCAVCWATAWMDPAAKGSLPAGGKGTATASGGKKGGQVVLGGKGAATASGVDASTRYFKKHMCKYWEAGRCDKGTQCTFAHGAHELAPSRGS